MIENNKLDQARGITLDKIESSARAYKGFFVGAACCELICLIAYFWLMDFHNKEHWLLLVMAFLIYGTVGIGLLALAAWNRHWGLRLLAAIELLDDRQASETLPENP